VKHPPKASKYCAENDVYSLSFRTLYDSHGPSAHKSNILLEKALLKEYIVTNALHNESVIIKELNIPIDTKHATFTLQNEKRM